MDPLSTTILVTGAGSGIGRGIAVHAASKGAHVVLLDRDEHGVAGTVDAIEALGTGSAEPHPVDLRDSRRTREVIERATSTQRSLDGLVNAAGILVEGTTTGLEEDDLLAALDVNLIGPWRTITAAAPALRASGGAIVNIASIEGLAAAPNHLAYSVSKAGLVALTRSVAVDLAPQVRCNTICPGTVLTPMSEGFLDQLDDPAAARALLASKTLVDRLGRPSDIATLTWFLLSAESSFINGTTIIADGGRLARVP